MEALLSPTEIDIVWQYATPIDGKDQNYIRQDFLGAEIHKTNQPLRASRTSSTFFSKRLIPATANR